MQDGRFKVTDRVYDEGVSVGHVCRDLNIPTTKISIIFVNNRHADMDRILREKDEIALFPPIGGG